MVSFHILLGAEDQRDRLVDHIIVEKKNVLFLVPDSPAAPFLKSMVPRNSFLAFSWSTPSVLISLTDFFPSWSAT